MRWRLAKRLLRMDGKDTCRCGERGDDLHRGCRGRGGRQRRWSAYHRIARRHRARWWCLIGFEPEAIP
jgi:hypothetical protein